MPLGYIEILDRAAQLAESKIAASGNAVPFEQTQTAESVFPHAARFVLSRLSKAGDNLQDFAQTFEIEISNGVGDLPPEVLREHLKSATFAGKQFVSWLPYADFQRYKFTGANQLDYFTTQGDRIFYVAANTSSYTGTVEMNAPSLPIVSEYGLQNVLIPERAGEEIILTIAAVLAGEMPIVQLMEM